MRCHTATPYDLEVFCLQIAYLFSLALPRRNMAVLIKKDNFKKGLPAGFGWNQNTRKITLTDQFHNLLTDDKDFAGRSKTFEVNDVDDVEAIRDELLSKPLIAVSNCFKRYKEYRGAASEESRQVEYYTMTDDFVVVLNTANNDVRNTMEEAFEKAKKLLNENAKFVIVFNLDESVRLWYAQVPHENSDPKSAQAVGASFYIAHNAQPKSKCGRCFECELPMQKVMWIFCFPCCLVSGVPYLCYRNCLRNIKDVKISTRFYTQEHGSVQPGTNLASLFQPVAPQHVTAVVTTQYPSNQQHPGQQQHPVAYGQPPMAPQYIQPQQPYPQSNQGYPLQYYPQPAGNQQLPYPAHQ